MKITKVTCDGCGSDLTTRSNIEDYRLVLASESKPGYGAGVYTCMGIYPAIERDHHFCGLRCLDHWRSRKKYESSLHEKFWDDWNKEHGTSGTNEFGQRWSSCPEVPRELREANTRDFAVKALEEFPLSVEVVFPSRKKPD